jgi:nicotinamidase-related amidase
MDFQTAIVEGPAVHGDGGDKKALLARAANLIDATGKAGMKIIYVVVGFRPGYPEVSLSNKSFSAILGTGRFKEG